VLDAIAWLDATDPQRAIRACGAKMGGLAELPPIGVRVPQGFAVTADAYRRHCVKTGLDEVIDAALGGLDSDAEAAGIETAARAVQAELTSRDMGADLAELITGAYEELSLRCLGVNVPVAVRSSAIGEDSATASFAGIPGGDGRVDALRPAPLRNSAGPAGCTAAPPAAGEASVLRHLVSVFPLARALRRP